MDIKELLSNELHKSDIEEIYGQIVKDDKFDKDVLYSLINDENQRVGMNIPLGDDMFFWKARRNDAKRA